MKISARNVFEGNITALVDGVINAEVEITLPGGDRIVAVVTESSAFALSKRAITCLFWGAGAT